MLIFSQKKKKSLEGAENTPKGAENPLKFKHVSFSAKKRKKSLEGAENTPKGAENPLKFKQC